MGKTTPNKRNHYGITKGTVYTTSSKRNTQQKQRSKEHEGTSSRRQSSQKKGHRTEKGCPRGQRTNGLYRTKYFRVSGNVHREKKAKRESGARPWTGTSRGGDRALGHSGGLDRLRLLPKLRLGGWGVRWGPGRGFTGRVVGFYT